MLNLMELEQFVSFAENGTLLKVSEKMNISQPTLTRSMQHVEAEFGVALFTRGKNRLELNETGNVAVEYARQLLTDERNAVQMVRDFDRNMRSITVAACAPAPLWTLLPRLSSKYPKNIISSKLGEIPDIISDVACGKIDIGILPFSYSDEKVSVFPFIPENLSVCVPKEHALASHAELTFDELNGFNCLLRDEIGFWTQMCRMKMPASRFLIQSDEFEFEELVRSSTLLCFITNLATDTEDVLRNRKIIPITDTEANVTYHLICRRGKELFPEGK